MEGDEVLTVEELGALVELVGRAPMSKAERLWVAALMERLRDWVLSADSGNGLNGSGAREGGNMEDAGQDWMEITAGGNTGYVRVYASK